MSFSTKNKQRLSSILNGILTLIAVLISMYYWFNKELNSMKQLPMGLFFLVFLYLLLDWIKIRFVKGQFHWWNYFSYLGGICLLYPIILGSTNSNLDTLNSITDFGVCFFFLSIGIDVFVMNKKRESNV